MSENERRSRAEIEQLVAKEFKAAGYEVSQSAGTRPGEVDWFARGKTNLERPTTYWQVWDACPAALDDALSALEETRKLREVDYALAVVDDALPVGYAADLQRRASNVITIHRLIFELRGIADRVREQKVKYEAGPEHIQFLPRRARTPDGEVADAVSYIKTWLQHSDGEKLAIVARQYSGRSSVIERVAYELALKFDKDPENTIPLVFASSDSNAYAFVPDLHHWGVRTVYAVDAEVESISDKRLKEETLLELLNPTHAEIEEWFQSQALAPETIEQFFSAREEVTDFKALSSMVSNLNPLIRSMRRLSPPTSKDAKEWMAEIVSNYVQNLFPLSVGEMYSGAKSETTTASTQHPDQATMFEDAAFLQFSLGQSAHLIPIADLDESKHHSAIISTWTNWGSHEFGPPGNRLGRRKSSQAITNSLILDYFIARKIVREIVAGNITILARHQFPKDYVLLFLATLSPSAAAQATAERGAEIRADIEIEVERRLQLTLAHLLKRSVGAIRLNVGVIQEGISSADAVSFHQEFSRIEEELSLQSALAEQTGRWQEVPNGTPEGLALSEILGAAIDPIRQKYPAVVCEIEVPALLRVRASRVGLREILHCLIENAFHAVAFIMAPEPYVSIRAVSEGDTIRLEIIDNGPGIRPEDRERIFEPYVTTKKDVGRPFGTGLGLAIARRYAAKIGAQVVLDADRPETCFVVRFVTWREPS